MHKFKSLYTVSMVIETILGILLMNSCNTDIFFSTYYHLQSVRFELVDLNYNLQCNWLI